LDAIVLSLLRLSRNNLAGFCGPGSRPTGCAGPETIDLAGDCHRVLWEYRIYGIEAKCFDWGGRWDSNPPSNINASTYKARLAILVHGKQCSSVLTDRKLAAGPVISKRGR